MVRRMRTVKAKDIKLGGKVWYQSREATIIAIKLGGKVDLRVIKAIGTGYETIVNVKVAELLARK